MSSHIGSLAIGDVIDCELSPNTFDFKKVSQKPIITMIAGGTGITPMVKIIMSIALSDTQYGSLLFCVQSENDIYLRHEVGYLVSVPIYAHNSSLKLLPRAGSSN